MSEDVQQALLSVFEQWDGGGFPRGLQRQDIPMPCRVVYLAAFFEVFHASGGRDHALQLTLRGRGRSFDPEAVDALLTMASEEAFWDAIEGGSSLWPLVMSLEPENRMQWISDEQLNKAVVALADFADMKSPYSLGHSRRVATTAGALARGLQLHNEDVVDVNRAALCHDLGLVAEPSFVLDRSPNKFIPITANAFWRTCPACEGQPRSSAPITSGRMAGDTTAASRTGRSRSAPR
jgi:HD-GYP domain-containing protein (c-di-GMP phosphodiesterase class II)